MQRNLYIIFVIAWLLYIGNCNQIAISNLSNSAFCQSAFTFQNRMFPTDVPEYNLPWIWEAIFDPVKNIVDVTTMSRYPCLFDKTQWKEIVKLFPKKKHQLGYGLDGNILVPFDVPWIPAKYLSDRFINCQYFNDDQLVDEIRSKRIRGIDPFSWLGSLQIRCPAPSISGKYWNSMRLEITPFKERYVNNSFTNFTVKYPVCAVPHYDPNSKVYNLTICSATNRGNRSHLVEWIEYYRLIGVQHFYLYDTSRDISDKSLSHILPDYVSEGIVTIIRWPFMSCVRNMAKGRFMTYRSKNGSTRSFYGPKPIVQYTALASCYSRFKHTSKYMIYVDDDEFMTYSIDGIASYLNISKKKHATSKSTSLVNIADEIFKKYTDASAMRFEPIFYLPCEGTEPGREIIKHNAIANYLEYRNTDSQKTISSPLPRIGIWNQYKPFLSFENKLLVKTENVGMFYIHYLSLIEESVNKGRFNEKSTVTLPLTHAALLHYKHPPALGDNILEGQWPKDPKLFEKECESAMIWRKSGGLHAQIPFAIATELKLNYEARMSS